MTQSDRIAIVDAYSAANQLAPTLRAAGAELVHVQSAPRIPAAFEPSFRPDDFVANVVHDTDAEATVAALRAHGVSMVVPGTESGVELADALATRIGGLANNPATTSLRRDKFAMIEALHRAGVPAARQRLCRSRGEVEQFAAEEGTRVVVKPLRSAGNDGVAFCDTPREAGAAFERIFGHRSALDETIDDVVVQAYLPGREYYVNTVSRDGRHRIAEIWLTTHIAANGVYNLLDSGILLPARGEAQDEVTAYATRCLDTLGVVNGPAHLEIKLTPQGPRLVELGARVCGGPLTRISRLGIGEGQLDWAARAYLDPAGFASTYREPYRLTRTVSSTALIAESTGHLEAYPGLERIRELETFADIIEIRSPGQRVDRTVGDFSYPMMIVLANEDAAAVERDSRTIRQIDGDAFYVMGP